MTAETLAAAILRDVPIRGRIQSDPTGLQEFVFKRDVIAALSRAMSDDLAERAGEVLEGVTPGPWSSEMLMQDDPNGDEWPTDIEVASQSGRHIHGHDLGYNPDVDLEIIANARFIATARELVPALIAQNAALRAERDRFEAALGRACLVGGTTYLVEKAQKAEARAERMEAAIRELKRCWYQGDLTENDFAAALKGADHE